MPSHLVAASAVAGRARARAGRAGPGRRGHGRLPKLHVLSVPQMPRSSLYNLQRSRRSCSGNAGNPSRPRRAPRCSALTAECPPPRPTPQGPAQAAATSDPPSRPSSACLQLLFVPGLDPVSDRAQRVGETAADPPPPSPRGPSISAVRTSRCSRPRPGPSAVSSRSDPAHTAPPRTRGRPAAMPAVTIFKT